MAATRWQYMRADSFDRLEALGAEGWELVGVTAAADGRETFYLKRPYPSIREQITLEQRERALAAAAGEGEKP